MLNNQIRDIFIRLDYMMMILALTAWLWLWPRAGLKQLLRIIIVSLEAQLENNMLSSFVESLSFGVGYLVCQGLNLGGLVSTIFLCSNVCIHPSLYLHLFGNYEPVEHGFTDICVSGMYRVCAGFIFHINLPTLHGRHICMVKPDIYIPLWYLINKVWL